MQNKKHDWPALLEIFSQSQLTQKQFCQQHGINPKYFSTRRLQLLKKESEGTSQFIKAEVVKPEIAPSKKPSQMRLSFPSGDLHFDTAIPPSYIASLLRDLS